MAPQALEYHAVLSAINTWIDTNELLTLLIVAICGGVTGWVSRRLGRPDRRLGWSVLYDESINQGDPDTRRRIREASAGPNGTPVKPSDHMWDITYEPKGGASVKVENGSLAVIEMRNIGRRAIEPGHVGTDGKFTVRFPGRKVVHFKIRDYPDPDNAAYHKQVEDFYDALEKSLGGPAVEPGKGNSFDLPGPKINPNLGFKLLVLLHGDPPEEGKKYPEPVIGTQITEGRFVKQSPARGLSRRWLVPLIAVGLALAVGGAVIGIGLSNQAQVPVATCASGQLNIEGSTAFAPVMNQVAGLYEQQCPQAQITIKAVGSVKGLKDLEGSSNGTPVIAMYDGTPSGIVSDAYQATPVGIVIFAVVANRTYSSPSLFATGPGNGMTGAEIAQAFTTGGSGVETFRPVGRTSDSGTRLAFDQEVLAPYGYSDPTTGNTPDCPQPGTPATTGLCQEPTTMDLLGYVNMTDNAIGYAEADALPFFPKVGAIPIGGYAPDKSNVLKGCYPFYATEHLYTRGAPTGLEMNVVDFLKSAAVTAQLRDASGFIPLADVGANSPPSTCSR